MSNQALIILLLGAVVAIYLAMALVAYFRMRGTRIVVCPETQEPAAVRVDPAHAAVSAVWETTDIQLNRCSRWPERKDCDQACTGQIAVAPKETLAFEQMKKWYANKSCAICRRTIPPLHHGGPMPGMLNVASPTHEILSWDEIPAEHLPAMFESHLPVCASCQVAESFRRQFPEMVVDRPGKNISVH